MPIANLKGNIQTTHNKRICNEVNLCKAFSWFIADFAETTQKSYHNTFSKATCLFHNIKQYQKKLTPRLGVLQ